MTISDTDLFMAILSMDAYNRGYDRGIALPGNTVGSATITADSSILTVTGQRLDIPAGFYAAAYNTDYGTVIGGATIQTTSNSDEDSPEVAAGFYAIAYNWNGRTVISYRGTNIVDGLPVSNDVYNGWAFAVGDFTADQLELSTQFLETMVYANVSNDIILTGHSLGVGRAALH